MTTHASERDDYRIAIFTQLKDPHELGRIFSEQLEMCAVDAELWAHHVPGILNESFSEQQARDLVASISALGIHVKAILRDEIPDLRRAIPVHHARCEEHGLQVIDLHGKHETLIPWPAVEMICLGEVPLETASHHAPDMWNGASTGHYGSHDKSKDPLATVLEVWVTCRPPCPNLRIDHERLNYEYLESRRTVSSEGNFRLFLNDLVSLARHALLTESTQEYLSQRPRKHPFKSLGELLRYATLNAVLAHVTADARAHTSPGQPSSPGAIDSNDTTHRRRP